MDRLRDIIRSHAVTIPSIEDDYADLLRQIGDASIVLLGEASHGTHEFYAARARITRRLITEKGFTAVAVEADWPDAYRVNRYVRGLSPDRSADRALGDFERFPVWMWRNTDVLEFVSWLCEYNGTRRAGEPRAGFYGLDLYSLSRSREAVIRYLDKVDTEAARRARFRYGCFDHFGEDPQSYGYAASFGMDESCERQVIEQLLELRRQAAEYATRDGRVAEDEFFYAEQNARLVRNAEQYYRSMFGSRASSWNLRDRHMADTLDALVQYLGRSGGTPKIAVWAHNSHLGDARATEMSEHGELNLGQLVRERHRTAAFLLGFTTHTGTVMAVSNWGEKPVVKRVRPGMRGSFEDLFHSAELRRFLLPLRDEPAADGLREPRLERAIGVIYRPESERVSHYFYARLSEQFDAVIHFDETSAVVPLGIAREPEPQEAPETFPSGL